MTDEMRDNVVPMHPQTDPEIAGEFPIDPSVVGELTKEEKAHVEAIQREGERIKSAIGEAEIRKARLLGKMSELEAAGQSFLQSVGKRLGIPDGAAWQILPDGKVMTITPPGDPSQQG